MAHEETTPSVPETPVTPSDSNRIALALFPFTPVPLTGKDALMGWGRLALYGSIAYMTWKPARKISYGFAGAAIVSAITSISGNAWSKNQ